VGGHGVSYDVNFEVEVLGETFSTETRNYTSNCSKMWRAAGCDIRGFHGKPVSEFIPPLTAAIADMEATPEFYTVMNPENGWGDYYSCLHSFLIPLLRDAHGVHPDARVWVWS